MNRRQYHTPYDDESSGFSPHLRRKFVLCFDGTGQKFSGTAQDSNILKIYSMLDRTDKSQFSYYQPGIGTYTTSKSFTHDSHNSKIHSALGKLKASAIGTTFDEHVMAGYRFLMRYYEDGDDIYFFGFSRGAYIARFLAEMLDHIGLLSAGNEELVRFVWKTFAQWQSRQGKDETEKEKLFTFMSSFRQTFSRPIRRIKFLGLFDTVNSVSRFEKFWLKRSKRFPYTARSTAITIRHAVSIDERRAKFRQDLISQVRTEPDSVTNLSPGPFHNLNDKLHRRHQKRDKRPHQKRDKRPHHRNSVDRTEDQRDLTIGDLTDRLEDVKPGPSNRSPSHVTRISQRYSTATDEPDADDDDNAWLPQDIEEIWFPGCHSDIGGGWPPDEPERLTLAHNPLVWMVYEAQKAGLCFDPDKMKALDCYYDEQEPMGSNDSFMKAPIIMIHGEDVGVNDPAIGALTDSSANTQDQPHHRTSSEISNLGSDIANRSFLDAIHSSCTRGKIHDSLEFKQGTSSMRVLLWKIMEHLPFRRMDLQPDGSWKVIRSPLPRGETRDIPDNVRIHHSVLRRMQADSRYRPGNLIVGGGGRGVRYAPESAGIGEWAVAKGKGHPIQEIWVKAGVTDDNTASHEDTTTSLIHGAESSTTGQADAENDGTSAATVVLAQVSSSRE